MSYAKDIENPQSSFLVLVEISLYMYSSALKTQNLGASRARRRSRRGVENGGIPSHTPSQQTKGRCMGSVVSFPSGVAAKPLAVVKAELDMGHFL